MNKSERLPVTRRKILEDGETTMPSSIAKQFNRLTKEKGKMSTDEVIAYVGLSAELVDIKRERATGKSTPLSHIVNSGIIYQPK